MSRRTRHRIPGRLAAPVTTCWAATRRALHAARRHTRADDRGEGVVSAAIVVLIMAAIGALMWVGFRAMWTDIEADTNEKISEVGT